MPDDFDPMSGLPEPEATLRAALVAQPILEANGESEASGAMQATARLLAGLLANGDPDAMSDPARTLRTLVADSMKHHGKTLATAQRFMERDGCSAYEAVQRATNAAVPTPGAAFPKGGKQ